MIYQKLNSIQPLSRKKKGKWAVWKKIILNKHLYLLTFKYIYL